MEEGLTGQTGERETGRTTSTRAGGRLCARAVSEGRHHTSPWDDHYGRESFVHTARREGGGDEGLDDDDDC